MPERGEISDLSILLLNNTGYRALRFQLIFVWDQKEVQRQSDVGAIVTITYQHQSEWIYSKRIIGVTLWSVGKP